MQQDNQNLQSISNHLLRLNAIIAGGGLNMSPPLFLLHSFNQEQDKTEFVHENKLEPKQAVSIHLNGTGLLCPNEGKSSFDCYITWSFDEIKAYFEPFLC
ncbi:MAG: hypothetical protein MUP98_12400 [Candidatus Aminicenantes bacterium]|nr:hypothetical protein [Candidatus Aminicenantes bacterium]